jgi:hypothetical protein
MSQKAPPSSACSIPRPSHPQGNIRLEEPGLDCILFDTASRLVSGSAMA